MELLHLPALLHLLSVLLSVHLVHSTDLSPKAITPGGRRGELFRDIPFRRSFLSTGPPNPKPVWVRSQRISKNADVLNFEA
jgi:hypothetical protein